MAIQKRFIHFKKFSDFNSKKLSANEANTQYTIGVSGAIQSGAPDILYQSYCWIKDTQQQWTHGQLYNGKEASGGEENVQSDWNVTDTSSDAYIKNKPTIPTAVTESTVSGWGFTKNTGTYSKPSTGIPKSDLASAVQTSLGKADTALQSYTEQYKGTITGVSANGTPVATSGVANIPAASTSAYGVTKLSSATNSTSTSLAATASAVKAAYDLANTYKGTVTKVKINGNEKSPDSNGLVDLGTIEGGGGSSGEVYEVLDPTQSNLTLQPNHTYILLANSNQDYTISVLFNSSSRLIIWARQFGSITMNPGPTWANNSPIEFEDNKTFEISFFNVLPGGILSRNLAVWTKYDIKLIQEDEGGGIE